MGFSFSCPLCKSHQNFREAYFNIINNVELFSLKARSYPHGSEKCLHYATNVARKEYSKIKSFLGNQFATDANYAALTVMDAEISYLEGRYNDAIVISEEAISKFEALSEEELASGSWREQRVSYFHRALGNIALSSFQLKDFTTALQALSRQLKLINFSRPTRGLRLFFQNMSRCTYELGMFEQSIIAGESSIVLNRSYEGVYTSIALSFKALGKLDHAIWIMQRAMRFETPWDEDNRRKIAALCEELKKEKESKIDTVTPSDPCDK